VLTAFPLIWASGGDVLSEDGKTGLLTRDYPKIDFGVTPLPGKTGGSASFAGGDCIGIPKNSKNVAEAWKFIQWCLQEDAQIMGWRFWSTGKGGESASTGRFIFFRS
jgi:ABC-type glycerol-3-phosphate transport system substrate-binding protein